MEEKKGNTLLKWTSIVMMIGGGLGILIGTIGALAIAALLGSYGGMGLWPLLLLAAALALSGSLVALIAGIFGLKYHRYPEKMDTCIALGAASLLLSLAGSIISYILDSDPNLFSRFAGLALPGLYLYAAVKGKQRRQEVI